MLGRIDSSASSLCGLPLDDIGPVDAREELAAAGEAEHGDEDVPEALADWPATGFLDADMAVGDFRVI
ncbi:unnamed protein product [Phytophthora fragariaefolia]|uniref:Unnamed protein product n=1 Tax=Phytophthora fragariaefolia TaxID=1490495 RepID=A0A9W6UCQ9_9STRA|nr:unnamed protein product [Phytophthora fragariaefolia]